MLQCNFSLCFGSISVEFADDMSLLGEMFLTLSKLAVRNEFCQEIMDLGGLKLIMSALENSIDNKVFRLLRD